MKRISQFILLMLYLTGLNIVQAADWLFHKRAWAQAPLGTIRKLIPSESK